MTTIREIQGVAALISQENATKSVNINTKYIADLNSSAASYRKEVKRYEDRIQLAQEKLDLLKEAKSTIKHGNILQQIKKLRFVDSVQIKEGYLEIRTNHLRIKSSKSFFDAGNYFIRLYTGGELLVIREKYEKLNLVGRDIPQHLVVNSNGEVCFGGNAEAFEFEIACGRYDTALTMLWGMLSNANPAPGERLYIHYKDFKQECRTAKKYTGDDDEW